MDPPIGGNFANVDNAVLVELVFTFGFGVYPVCGLCTV